MKECNSGELITGWTKLKYLEKNLLKCHCVHQRFRMDYPEIELGLHGENPASNHLSCGVSFPVNNSPLLYHKKFMYVKHFVRSGIRYMVPLYFP
jgi:hypothetical protein